MAEYQGYRESGGQSIVRREPATSEIPLILNFGEPFTIDGSYAAGGGPQPFHSFVAGMGDSFAVVGSAGSAYCMQANFSPLGAYRILRLPMHEIAAKVADLELLWGRSAQRLLDRLYAAPGWEPRFELLDRFLLDRLARARPAAPEVEAAWERLRTSHGALPVDELARELGWSRRHLARRFQQQLGQPPKTVARILRFERARRRALDRPRAAWSEIALDCGYSDQAHLIREFRSLSGLTPPELDRRTDSDGGGVLEPL